MTHAFLLIGQSNAAGRGLLRDAPALDDCDDRLKVLRNGRWQTMFRPVNPDRSFSGTCLAESFAKAYAQANPGVEVGIIPCADGGTTLAQWMPGELLFDNAVNCAKLAMRTSVLVGVLWHQGESDCAPDRYPYYAEQFQKLADTLRKELGLPRLPILVGGLGDFLPLCAGREHGRNYLQVNIQLQKVAAEDPDCRFVPADGLGANADNLHFNAESLEAFGLRYFEALRKMDLSEITVQKPTGDDSMRTTLEKL